MLKKLAMEDPAYLDKIKAENIPFKEDEEGRESRYDNSFLETYEKELMTEQKKKTTVVQPAGTRISLMANDFVQPMSTGAD